MTDNQRDKILFKHYQYRGGSEYVDIIMAMDEYALKIAKEVKEACALQAEKHKGIDCLIRETIDINKFVP